MSNSPLLNRAEVLAIYGGLCGLLYVETDGFRREVPCVNMMPPIFLTLFTLTTRMNGSVKLCTSSAFLVFALGIYSHSSHWHNDLQIVCALFTIGHISYILSFISCIRRLWRGCAVLITIYNIAFLYFCFIDLLRSIPTLVINLSLHFITLATSLIAAGSIWHYGSQRGISKQAALMRCLGLLSLMIYSSLLVLNRFANHIDRSNYMSTLSFYIAQPLLLFANEQTF